jgi:hypothetical protein
MSSRSMSVSRKSGKSGLLKAGKNVDDNNESYGFLAPAITYKIFVEALVSENSVHRVVDKKITEITSHTESKWKKKIPLVSWDCVGCCVKAFFFPSTFRRSFNMA